MKICEKIKSFYETWKLQRKIKKKLKNTKKKDPYIYK